MHATLELMRSLLLLLQLYCEAERVVAGMVGCWAVGLQFVNTRLRVQTECCVQKNAYLSVIALNALNAFNTVTHMFSHACHTYEHPTYVLCWSLLVLAVVFVCYLMMLLTT